MWTVHLCAGQKWISNHCYSTCLQHHELLNASMCYFKHWFWILTKLYDVIQACLTAYISLQHCKPCDTGGIYKWWWWEPGMLSQRVTCAEEAYDCWGRKGTGEFLSGECGRQDVKRGKEGMNPSGSGLCQNPIPILSPFTFPSSVPYQLNSRCRFKEAHWGSRDPNVGKQKLPYLKKSSGTA